jgi:ABC-type lipoprotein export system ATPase subunit
MSAAISVRDAFCVFGSGATASVALQGLTLTVEPEEIVVVLGPSGSGKTTLLRTVGGFERLSAGSVHVFGVDLSRLNERALATFRAEHFGFLDQHYTRALSPDLSILHTVALQLMLRGSAPDQAYDVAGGLLDRAGLGNRRADRPGALSGGEQQRVAVCAAIAHRPRLLLIDEPAGELDASNAVLIYDLLAEMAKTARAAALIVSHDPGAASIADRLLHVRDGRVVEQAVPGADARLVVSKGGWIRLPADVLDHRDRQALVTVHRPRQEVEVSPLRHDATLDGSGDAAAVDRTRDTQNGDVVAELTDVRKVFRANGNECVALAGMSMRVGKGHLVAVMGRSGSGKTTLLHLLAGLERPTQGEIVVLGESLNGKGRSELAGLRRRLIGLVTQEPGLVPQLSVSENVMLGLALRGTPAPAARATSAIEEVGLLHKSDQRVSSLSAGERQRVAIARAIAADTPLLLADEPTARLDEENALAVGRLLARAAHVHELTVVCATHDPVLIELADAVVDLELRQAAD